MDKDELMGRDEYARHRGCAPNAVKKAEDDGRIAAAVVRENGTFVGIKWRIADELWAANTDPVEAARTSRASQAGELVLVPQGGDDPAQGGAEAGPAPIGNADQAEYLRARAQREGFQAKQAELEYLQAIGYLIPAKEQREVAQRRYRTLRDTVMNISERNASIVAAAARAASTNDEAAAHVHKLLNDEFKRVLHELSNAARAEVAGGVAEPVAA